MSNQMVCFLGGILMKIQLPKSFEYHEKGIYANVHDGILEITPTDFEKVMYQLTYQLKDRKRCYYCHRMFKSEDLTLDHVFPRDCGGVSIPNNLKPCCKNCNQLKSNLLPWQFKNVREVSKRGENVQQLIQYYQFYNWKKKEEIGILIPEAWYEMRKDYAVFTLITSEIPFKESKKYQRIMELYETYGKICKPIVISQNRFVLDGFMSLLVAKNLGIKEPLPFVTLENVIVI